MAGQQYEIEIKSLLGDENAAEGFRKTLRDAYPDSTVSPVETQLNHYFEGGDLEALAKRLASYITAKDRTELDRIKERATSVSVRTREVGGTVRFIVKASLGNDSSHNGVARVEVDASVEGLSLEDLDAEILAAGYRYQAKWSRSRQEYLLDNVTVCLDRNAGYGYLAEFEKVVDNEADIKESESELRSLMERLGAQELPQERLERMFAHYNEHWPEYYGTSKVFIID